MSIVHVVGKGGSLPTDRSLFIGPSVPGEVKALPKLLKNVDKATLRKFLQVLVRSFEGEDLTREAVQDLVDTLTEDIFARIYSGLYRLLQSALRISQHSLKQDVFREDLVELRIPQEFIPDIASVVYGSRRKHIDAANLKKEPHLPKLNKFRWRVDVTISTSVLNRVLEPTIFMEMQVSDGKTHNFEVPIRKFHLLRYNVAQILKDMENLEQRGILKIQD